MEDRPLISYVVTAFNIEQYIEEAVQCAFLQTYSPLEIILSDDCSSDRTYEIMENMAANYCGPHTIILNRNKHNLGITQHMNKAYLELAHGELIVAAHGDDFSVAERTEKSYLFMKEHLDVTACSFGIDAFDDEGHFLQEHSSAVAEVRYYDFASGGNIPAPSRCFYKKVMETFGPLNDDCPTEDELITFRSLMLGRNAFLPEHLVKYRKHRGSSSNPENFARFPLDKIVKQQNQDMEKAVELGLITEEQRVSKLKELERGRKIRERYRKYFANRTVSNLMHLVLCPGLSPRGRLSYCRQHIRYITRK